MDTCSYATIVGLDKPSLIDEDEEQIEKEEEFERVYNFRYEEPNGTEIPTYSRQLEGTVRRHSTKRKQQREEVNPIKHANWRK